MKCELLYGTILKGEKYQYKIQKLLGQGSFGITYLATILLDGNLGTISSNTQIAIKEFYIDKINSRHPNGTVLGTDSKLFCYYQNSFKKESKHLSEMENSGIVKVLESFDANNTSYYVMEYIDGEPLSKTKELSVTAALKLFKDIVKSLKYMHDAGMCHLDLKPGNIMLTKDFKPILIDFGLSKYINKDGESETTTTIGLGTHGYAPLEQINGLACVQDAVTIDIYALGATFFNLLTGIEPPHASMIAVDNLLLEKFLIEKCKDLRIVKLVIKMMSPRKQDRPQSLDEIDIPDEIIPSPKPYILKIIKFILFFVFLVTIGSCINKYIENKHKEPSSPEKVDSLSHIKDSTKILVLHIDTLVNQNINPIQESNQKQEMEQKNNYRINVIDTTSSVNNTTSSMTESFVPNGILDSLSLRQLLNDIYDYEFEIAFLDKNDEIANAILSKFEPDMDVFILNHPDDVNRFKEKIQDLLFDISSKKKFKISSILRIDTNKNGKINRLDLIKEPTN